jgi:preprotein translocase subunit SecD
MLIVCRALAVALSLTLTAANAAEFLVVEPVAARKDFDQRTGQPIVTVTLKDAKALGEFTARHVGRMMEIRADGKVIVTSRIREPLLGGRFLSGSDVRRAETLAEFVSSSGTKLEIAATNSN